MSKTEGIQSTEEGFGTVVEAEGLVPKPPVSNRRNPKDTYPADARLQDEEWDYLKGCLPRKRRPWRRKDRRGGRPRADDRLCFEAVLSLMRRGAALRSLPAGLGARSTIQRRIEDWGRRGSLELLWRLHFERMDPERRARFRGAAQAAAAERSFWRSQLYGLVLALTSS